MIREPAVAGQFYPDEKTDLKRMIRDCFEHELGPGTDSVRPEERVFGVVSPHAGYVYSGPTASHSYRSISNQNPELAVVIGPNHFGVGRNVATMTDAKWRTPLGTVRVNSEAARQVSEISKTVEVDHNSHSQDHSIEVQIPMLQTVLSDEFEILPIILLSQDLETARDVGDAISEAVKGRDSIIVASSDLTHYERDSFARAQDMALIEPILELDVEKFYQILAERRVSACGYGAIAAAMIACRNLGATRGELLSYTTSGEISGDNSSVVGYGSIKFV